MGWIITGAVLFLLAILPLGASVAYDSSGALVRIIAGPIRITLFPRKKKTKEKPKKEKKPKAASEKKKKAPAEGTAEKEKEKKGGSWTDFLPLVQVGLDFLGQFRRKLRVNCLQLKLVMAGGDPCDLAINYSRAWAITGNLLSQLDRLFVIKKRDIQVECDFMEDEMLVTARLDITITLGRLLSLVTVTAVRGLREFLKIRKKRKAVS